MKKVILFLFLSAFSLIMIAQNRVMLDVNNAETKISKHIYGHFAEHLGRVIYGVVVPQIDIDLHHCDCTARVPSG